MNSFTDYKAHVVAILEKEYGYKEVNLDDLEFVIMFGFEEEIDAAGVADHIVDIRKGEAVEK